jgi:hypothetical protein
MHGQVGYRTYYFGSGSSKFRAWPIDDFLRPMELQISDGFVILEEIENTSVATWV